SRYRTQAGAICTATSAKLKKVKAPRTKKEIGPFLEESLPIFEGQYGKLKKLDPPKVLRFLHGKVLKLERQQIDGIQDLIDAIDAGADPATAFPTVGKRLAP